MSLIAGLVCVAGNDGAGITDQVLAFSAVVAIDILIARITLANSIADGLDVAMIANFAGELHVPCQRLANGIIAENEVAELVVAAVVVEAVQIRDGWPVGDGAATGGKRIDGIAAVEHGEAGAEDRAVRELAVFFGELADENVVRPGSVFRVFLQVFEHERVSNKDQERIAVFGDEFRNAADCVLGRQFGQEAERQLVREAQCLHGGCDIGLVAGRTGVIGTPGDTPTGGREEVRVAIDLDVGITRPRAGIEDVVAESLVEGRGNLREVAEPRIVHQKGRTGGRLNLITLDHFFGEAALTHLFAVPDGVDVDAVEVDLAFFLFTTELLRSQARHFDELAEHRHLDVLREVAVVVAQVSLRDDWAVRHWLR